MRDWPANELEQQIHQASMRRALEGAGLLTDDPAEGAGDAIVTPLHGSGVVFDGMEQWDDEPVDWVGGVGGPADV